MLLNTGSVSKAFVKYFYVRLQTFWTPLITRHEQWKKRSERRKHCALAVVRRSQKNFAPPQTPSCGCGMTKIKSAGDGHYLYQQTQFGEDQCTQFRVIMVTDPPSHKQTRSITIHCASASAQCKYKTAAFHEKHNVLHINTVTYRERVAVTLSLLWHIELNLDTKKS